MKVKYILLFLLCVIIMMLGNIARGYDAFGGEHVLSICIMLYCLYDYVKTKEKEEYHENICSNKNK